MISVEWFAVGFFLVSLILFRQCEKPIKAESVEGYRRISGGLILLSLTAMARLYQSMGMLQQVPFLSETVFFDLIYWVMVMAGGAMIVSGAAHWLPLARQNKQLSQVRIDRLDLLRRIEQLIGVENRLDTILTHALQYMREASKLDSGAVVKFSSDGQRLRIVSTTPDFEGGVRELEQGICSRMKARQVAGKMADPVRFLANCLAQERGKPAVTVPIEVTDRAVGMFVFWCKGRAELEPDVRLILQLAADVVARKVAMDSLSLRFHSRKERAAWHEKTRTSVEAASDTRLKFAVMSKAIAERFHADTVTLTVMPQAGGRVRRFTWTRGDRTLVEYQLSVIPIDSLTGPAFHAGHTVVYHDLSQERRPIREEILAKRLAGSLAALPVRIAEDITTVLTVTSEQENAFTGGIIAEIRRLSPIVALVVLPDLLQETHRREAGRMEKLAHMLHLACSEDNQQSSLIALASLACEEYGADLVRFSQIDETGKFLESRVLVSAVSLQCTVPAHGRIILALTPVHEQVLKTGLPMLVFRQGDKPDFSEIETSQTLADGVKHVAIVPVLRDGRSIGVMTLGAVDHALTGVRDSSGLAFAEALASVAAMYLKSASRASIGPSSERARWKAPEETAPSDRIDSRISTRSSGRVLLNSDIFS